MLSSLAKKWSPNSLNWIFSWFFPPSFSWYVCMCVFCVFWLYSGDCGLDITKWHKTPQRIIFFECCRGERSTSGWPIFRASLVLLFHEEGLTQKTDETEGGMGGEVRGQGQMSCSQREKHIAFHQPPEKEVIHNSVDTIWPWMCELGVRCHHAATGRQVKKKKKCHFSPDYLTAQERITDWGSMVKGEKGHTKDNKKGNLNPPRLRYCSRSTPENDSKS